MKKRLLWIALVSTLVALPFGGLVSRWTVRAIWDRGPIFEGRPIRDWIADLHWTYPPSDAQIRRLLPFGRSRLLPYLIEEIDRRQNYFSSDFSRRAYLNLPDFITRRLPPPAWAQDAFNLWAARSISSV